jgi:hypothetical protein
MSDRVALGGDLPAPGTQHLIARGPTFGQVLGNAGNADVEPPPTFGELRGNTPSTPDVPKPAFGGYFGSYSGHGSRPGSGSISAPSPRPFEAPPINADVSPFVQHSGSQMPNLGSGSGEAEGEAGAEAGAGAAEAGAAEGGAEAAASIPEILGLL